MKGQKVVWLYQGVYKSGNIYGSDPNTDTYDIVLGERNVPIENIFTSIGNKPQVDDIILYKKNKNIYEALVCKIDYGSQSVQIKIIVRDIHYSNLFNDDNKC